MIVLEIFAMSLIDFDFQRYLYSRIRTRDCDIESEPSIQVKTDSNLNLGPDQHKIPRFATMPFPKITQPLLRQEERRQ